MMNEAIQWRGLFSAFEQKDNLLLCISARYMAKNSKMFMQLLGMARPSFEAGSEDAIGGEPD